MNDFRRHKFIEAHVEECVAIYAMVRKQLPNMPTEAVCQLASAAIISLAVNDTTEVVQDRAQRLERSIDDLRQQVAASSR